ncbi:hypothetical protein Aerorivi_02712 [Aeromonas rivipollensis]|uniref:phage head spike fiber domain-containing protein n=1 Tax=Aeromonas rivipollensis TaxID=948519 RepID=UPI00399CDE03
MAGLWQRTGNVTVTNGSKIVTGFGTKWKTGTLPIQKGHTFYGPDNFAYEVDTVVSDESLTLVEAYRGGTLANQGYRIDITRTSTISQFAADLASLVAKYRAWFDGMMTWLTGSGDVAILNPDTGANVTIPSWKKVASEGEGQTARAKVEADRAKTEADRALTEADRAAGIVAAATLPLPDVWAPLSDSLRLITGYGRDVLVGSDVVARMVNFSRNSTATYIGKDGQLKTAAANEPRFEKEGLLIEGQSTNLWLVSEGASQLGAAVSTAVAASGFNLRTYTGTEPANKDVAVPQSTTITVSVAFLVNGTPCKIAVQSRDGQGFTSWFGIDASGNVAVHPTITFAAVSSVRVGNVVRVAVTLPPLALTTTLRLYRWDSTSVQGDTFGCIQVEQLPFASSYIPTNGAAVTRAADIMTIPCALNWPANVQNERTVAAQVVNMRFTSGYPRMFTYDSGNGGIWYDGNQFASNEMNPVGRFYVTKDKLSEPHVHAEVHNKDYLQCYMSNVGMGPKGVRGSNPTYKADIQLCTFPYCHIRNVRIWHKVLNDSQIKAIA